MNDKIPTFTKRQDDYGGAYWLKTSPKSPVRLVTAPILPDTAWDDASPPSEWQPEAPEAK